MSGVGDSGPKKLSSSDKNTYKEISNTQAAVAKDKVQAVNQQARAKSRPRQENGSGAVQEQPASVPNWRKGKFGEPSAGAEKQPAANGAQQKGGQAQNNGQRPKSSRAKSKGANKQEENKQQERPKTACYGADLIIDEERKVSKHAKRRANKKAKQQQQAATPASAPQQE